MSGGSGFIKDFSEGLTKYCGVITSDHAYIHKGIGYTYDYTASSVAAGSGVKIGFSTPNLTPGKYLHWRPSSVSSTAILQDIHYMKIQVLQVEQKVGRIIITEKMTALGMFYFMKMSQQH